MTFFRQHNVDSSDIMQKYKSRAAQLYRDKLHQLATQAMRLHGTKVHIYLKFELYVYIHPNEHFVYTLCWFMLHLSIYVVVYRQS